jgi:glycosyltransferase involved in cell wall biosynthesis
VLPTFYAEGLPRSILEAMASSRPIITTDTPGCRLTINLGKNGILIKPKNGIELYNAMEYFINHPELQNIMGKESRKFVEQKFDVHMINDKICNFLNL